MIPIKQAVTWLASAVRTHWLALALLIPAVNWVVWQSDADNALPLLPLPLAALLIGFALRPRHVWFLWLGSVLLTWITVGLWGKYDGGDSGETTLTIMLEAFVWMAMGVWLPAWLGRLARTFAGSLHHPDHEPGGASSA